MNAFDNASDVEARGLQILRPWLERNTAGRYVLTAKGAMSRFMQLYMGDVIANDRAGKVWTLEIKVEDEASENFFIETWSNRNLEDRRSHIEHGSNQGWLYHSRADALLYYFIGSDDLYLINLFKLKQWAFGSGKNDGAIYRYPEVRQKKRSQANDTWGRLIDKGVLFEKVGFKHCKVRQLALWSEDQAA